MMKFLLLSFTTIFYFSIASGQANKSNSSAGITIDLPLINNANFYRYSLNGEGNNENQTGYLGAGFAFFYKKDKNKFSFGFENPSIDKSFFTTKAGSPNLNVSIFEATINHKISSQFALIGGINYVNYRYQLSTDIPPFTKIDKKDKALGLTAGAEFVPSNSVSVSVTYRPSVFCFDKKKLQGGFFFGIEI